MAKDDDSAPVSYLGIGCYTVAEASRLLHLPALNVRRWLGGYSYRERGAKVSMPPLWAPQIERIDGQLLLGFRDLIELRFVDAFLQAGLGLKTVRACIEYARSCVGDDRPFSTRQFKTDGRTIFLDLTGKNEGSGLLDLKNRQYVIKGVIERSFRDLDVEAAVVVRWRPFGGKSSIVVDPALSLGKPITASYGVPTVALADAAAAEGSPEAVARLFEVPLPVVRDAIAFERSLQAA